MTKIRLLLVAASLIAIPTSVSAQFARVEAPAIYGTVQGNILSICGGQFALNDPSTAQRVRSKCAAGNYVGSMPRQTAQANIVKLNRNDITQTSTDLVIIPVLGVGPRPPKRSDQMEAALRNVNANIKMAPVIRSGQ
jgi:hypothetical protein